MSFLSGNKDVKVSLLSELPEGLNLSKEFDLKNKRGEYKQIQADLRLDNVQVSDYPFM